MYRISKSFMISAAHQLNHLPEQHPCTRIHGHDYQITIFLESETLQKPVGFVKDYRELDAFKNWLNALFDHQFLNKRLPYGLNPSAENIAKFIFDSWKGKLPLWGVEVKETPKTSALYYE